MKTKILIISILITTVLLLSNLLTLKFIILNNNHIRDLQQNQKVLFSDSINKIIQLNKHEFKQLLAPVLDSIEKIKGVKSKHISNVTKIYNNYYDSTLIINQSPQISDSIFDISIKDSCWGFNGYFNIFSKTTTISDRWFNDDITKFTYYQRDRLFNLKWAPRWGKKHYYISSFSKCNSELKVEEFQLKKKKD